METVLKAIVAGNNEIFESAITHQIIKFFNIIVCPIIRISIDKYKRIITKRSFNFQDAHDSRFQREEDEMRD